MAVILRLVQYYHSYRRMEVNELSLTLASRVLTRPERCYCVIRKELLAVVFLLDISDHISWEESFGFVLTMDP